MKSMKKVVHMDGVSYPYKLFLDPPLGFVIKLWLVAP